MNIQTGDESTSRGRRRPTSPCARQARHPAAQQHRRDVHEPLGVVGRSGRFEPGATASTRAFSFFQNVSARRATTRRPRPTASTATTDSYQGRFDYGADRYGAQLEYLKVGDNFNPEVGFVRRDDFDRIFGAAALQPAPEERSSASASSPGTAASSTS